MPEARYKPLVDRLAADIRAGRLAPGTRLPTHRALAAQHGFALVTATRVYAALTTMGLVSGETGRGTYVKDLAVPPGHGVDQGVVAANVVDLAFNYPALAGQADLLRQGLRRLATAGDLDALLRYQPHGGRPHERAVVAGHLARQGIVAPREQVMLVDGAQHGLAVTAMALLQPGDVVATDALTYPGFKLLAQAHRLELVAVPMMDPDALDALCRRRRVRAVYTMPTLHNPLGTVVPLAQREALVAVARRRGLVLVEDAAYAFLVRNAPPPLAALAPECTVHVSGFSKSVATGLRVGHVVAPADWVPGLERAIHATTWNTPGVMTALVCGWIEDGTVLRMEGEKRRDAARRQTIATEVLGDFERVGHPGAYFTWLPLPEGARADRVAAALLGEGVSVSTAEPFAVTAQPPHAIRLALGSVDVATLRDALRTVARVVGKHMA